MKGNDRPVDAHTKMGGGGEALKTKQDDRATHFVNNQIWALRRLQD